MKRSFIIISLIFLAVLLTGCRSPQYSLTKSTNLTTITTSDYLLIYPSNIKQQQNTTLIYIITPTGSLSEAQTTVKYWQPFIIDKNIALSAPINWDQTKLVSILKQLQQEYQFRQIYATGFSNGGYNSCTLGLNNPTLITGIIPMGAYCSLSDVTNPSNINIPILIIVGQNDTWARGNDLQNIDNANQKLQKIGFQPKVIIVPDLGHSYPQTQIDKVIQWISSSS